MAKKKKTTNKYKLKTIIPILITGIVVGTLGYFAVSALTPVNADYPVFASPTNYYLKAIKSPDIGYTFAKQSVKGGKVIPNVGARDPTLFVQKGSLVSLHIINEEKNLSESTSVHNINIDEFNVHSRDLGYFETQTISFLADKAGEFHYYCSIHPEMNGKIVVQEE